MTMGASPHHDAKESSEVCSVHDDHDFIGCEFLLLNDNMFELPLHPLGATPKLLCNLFVCLFTMSEFLPDFLGVFLSLFATFFTA